MFFVVNYYYYGYDIIVVLLCVYTYFISLISKQQIQHVPFTPDFTTEEQRQLFINLQTQETLNDTKPAAVAATDNSK